MSTQTKSTYGALFIDSAVLPMKGINKLVFLYNDFINFLSSENAKNAHTHSLECARMRV